MRTLTRQTLHKSDKSQESHVKELVPGFWDEAFIGTPGNNQYFLSYRKGDTSAGDLLPKIPARATFVESNFSSLSASLL